MLKFNPFFAKTNKGFSLIEMAIVLLIISALLGGLLVSISTTREISNRNSTETTIDEIVEALYGFAQATGRLPCPATATSDGVEVCPVSTPANGRHGFVPSATLGLSGPLNNDNLLTDDWLGAYRYSVSTVFTNNFTTNISARPISQLIDDADLQVCDVPACTNVLADNLPAVVLSLGADWDAFTSVNEIENSGETTTSGYRMPNDRIFISTGYIEDSFDDILGWVSPSILVSRLVAAGQLP
jgi:prepilin-type N-terminal cleavage/methylation domain-containing protein